jgi:hypothetical protein
MSINRFLSIILMVISIIVAFVADHYTTFFRGLFFSRIVSASTAYILSIIVLFIVLIALIWIALFADDRDNLVGVLFLLVGLITLWLSTPYSYALIAPMLGSQTYAFLENFGEFGFLTVAGAIITVLGIGEFFRA